MQGRNGFCSMVRQRRRSPQAKARSSQAVGRSRRKGAVQQLRSFLRKKVTPHVLGVLTGVLGILGFVLASSHLYYNFFWTKSGLIVQFDHFYFEGEKITSPSGTRVQGKLDVTLVFSNDGNRDAIVYAVRWEVQGPSKPVGCDMLLATTQFPFQAKRQYGEFPLIVGTGRPAIVDLTLPFELSSTVVEAADGAINSCFTFEFSDFRGEKFFETVPVCTLRIDQLAGMDRPSVIPYGCFNKAELL